MLMASPYRSQVTSPPGPGGPRGWCLRWTAGVNHSLQARLSVLCRWCIRSVPLLGPRQQQQNPPCPSGCLSVCLSVCLSTQPLTGTMISSCQSDRFKIS